MIQELLVIFACAHNSGCSESTSQYRMDHPETDKIIKHQTIKARDYVGPEAMIVAPFIMLTARGRGTFSLNKYFSLQLSAKDANMVLFRYNF